MVEDLYWTVSEDQHGSDHIPIIVKSVNTSMNDHNTKLKLNKVIWELYHTLCDKVLKVDNFDNFFDPIADFTPFPDMSNKRIPETSTKLKKSKP